MEMSFTGTVSSDFLATSMGKKAKRSGPRAQSGTLAVRCHAERKLGLDPGKKIGRSWPDLGKLAIGDLKQPRDAQGVWKKWSENVKMMLLTWESWEMICVKVFLVRLVAGQVCRHKLKRASSHLQEHLQVLNGFDLTFPLNLIFSTSIFGVLLRSSCRTVTCLPPGCQSWTRSWSKWTPNRPTSNSGKTWERPAPNEPF